MNHFPPIAPPAHELSTRPNAPTMVGVMGAFDAALDRLTCGGLTLDDYPEAVHVAMTNEDAGEAFLMAMQKLFDAERDGSITPAQSHLFSLLEPIYVDACQLCELRLLKVAKANHDCEGN